MPHTNPYIAGVALQHVALRTPHFDRSVKFYVDVLGCTPKLAWGPAGKRYAMLDVGDGNCIELVERDEPAHEPTPAAEARMLHLCLRCTNLEEVVERVREAGMTVQVEPKVVTVQNRADGLPSEVELFLAFFAGPGGEVIELIQCGVL
ncbi:MAG: VOC family protein [Planctomycetota bacterium]